MSEPKSFNLTDQTNAFKINYYKRSENMYNSDNVLQGRIKKKYDFTGKRRDVNTPLSFSGGVGAGKLPLSNAGDEGLAVITAKRVYATCTVEREAIYASANNEGAFVKATALTVKKTVESYMRNCSRILFGDGIGILGKGDGTGDDVIGDGSIATPFVVTIPEAQWKEQNWEERDFVQVVTGLNAANLAGLPEGGIDAKTNLLEVVLVDPILRKISLVGVSPRLTTLAAGPLPLAATDGFSMQRSYNREPQGLGGVLRAESGLLYQQAVQRRWSSFQKKVNGQGVTVDMVNEVFLQVHKRFGAYPNMIICGYEQYQNMLALMEDQKRYQLPNRNLKMSAAFKGVEWMTPVGEVGVFMDRFADSDKIYVLNDNFIEVHHRPGFGWFEDDGTVFLRSDDEDQYEARYGGYYENYITPTAHGLISELAV